MATERERSFVLCHCGHYELNHAHYRPGSDCGLCSCSEFVTHDEHMRRTRRGMFVVLPVGLIFWTAAIASIAWLLGRL